MDVNSTNVMITLIIMIIVMKSSEKQMQNHIEKQLILM